MLKETCGIVGTFSASCNWHSAISHPLPPLHNAQQKESHDSTILSNQPTGSFREPLVLWPLWEFSEDLTRAIPAASKLLC